MKFDILPFLLKIWKDPVWSKVISVGILSIISLFFLIIEKNTIEIENVFSLFLLIIILILILIIIKKNNTISTLFYFDRVCKFVSIHNKFTLNKEGSLDLEQKSRRIIKCVSGKINFFDFGPSADVGIYNRTFESAPEVIKVVSANKNDLKYKNLNKNEGSVLKYRFELTKPLLKNEIIEFELCHKIKNFKIGSKDELLKYLTINKESFERNFEYSSFIISYPTDKFEYTIEFDYNCKIDSLELDVLVNQNPNEKEFNNAIKQLEERNTKNSKIFSLKIDSPKLKNKYRFKWKPPII